MVNRPEGNLDSDDFYCISCIKDNLPFTKISDSDFFSITKRNTILSDKVLDDGELRFVQCQNYIKQLNHYISHSFSQIETDNEFSSPPIDCKFYTLDDFTNAKFNPNKNLSIFHINIHSIERHLEELKSYLTLINFEFDIITISESKIMINTLPQIDIEIDGYQTPLSTPTEATKGGVLLYVHKKHVYKPKPDLKIYSKKLLESHFIELINQNGKNSIVGIIYRHPSMNPVDFNETYLKPLLQDKLSKELINKNVYIAGDFNFDLLKVSSPETSNFFDLMTSSSLLPTISLPTKFNNNSTTLLDNIFTNQFNPDMTSGNFTLQISDHLASFLIIPNSNQQFLPKHHNILKRDSRNFNNEHFLAEINEINWDHILQFEQKDTNLSFNIFYDKIESILDKHMPMRKITKKEFRQRYKPWVTYGILTSMRRRDRLLKAYINNKNPTKKEALHNEYKALRNHITNLLRDSKIHHYQNFFHENNKNLRKVWQGIKEIINIKNKSSDSPSCIIENGKLISDPFEVSNSFNSYYSSIAGNILERRKYTGDGNFLKYMPNSQPNSIVIAPVDSEEINLIIKSFNTKKATGPCSIPPKILNFICDSIVNPLSKLANLSFHEGVHPDRLKVAKVIPIYKSGSKTTTGNYRPISLLSNLNKIFEKLIFSRLYSFLDKENIIYKLQFGFRPKHSTSHALISITEKVKEALDNNKFTCGVFIDLQKAFDTVNHEIILKKLYRYGIRGKMHDWFTSYLTDRLQFVSILGIDSDKLTIQHGVPQGSVLGPLLFLLYINDIHNAINYSKTYLFADDTNLLNINKNFKKMQR